MVRGDGIAGGAAAPSPKNKNTDRARTGMDEHGQETRKRGRPKPLYAPEQRPTFEHAP
jgi:hypothetical protein